MANYNCYQGPDGTNRVSVTTVIKESCDKSDLVYWFKKTTAEKAVELRNSKLTDAELLTQSIAACDAVRDAAGDKGSQVHGIIQSILLGNVIDISKIREDLIPYMTVWMEWYKKQIFSPKYLEKVIHSKHGYSGTGDYFGMYNGKFSYIDWKTSKYSDKDNNPLQCGAYIVGYEELNEEKIEGVYIAQIVPGKGVIVEDYSDKKEESINAWFAALHLWKFRHRTSRKFKEIIKEKTDESDARVNAWKQEI